MAVEPTRFPEVLRRRRLEAGLSQDALALRSGLSTDAIAALERGRRKRPRADTVAMLADGLGLLNGERTAFMAYARGRREPEKPPQSTAAAAHVASPRRVTSLIARETELASLLELLRTKAVITLTGPGGIGKTRLALEVMDRTSSEQSFVDLSSVRDSRLVAGVIGEHHGVGADARVEDLVAYFKSRSMLLVLDNFEQVIDAALLVAALADSSPNLRILITSRMPLQIRAEQRFAVTPLPAPPKTAEGISGETYPAVRLFLERARAVHPGLRNDASTLRAVGTICRRLDGLPLAIELAAARVRILPPQSMVDRLGRRLEILNAGARDLPDRQQTLRTTLDWSHELLTDEEQHLFASLGSFEGGASIEAIDAVCSDGRCDVVGDLEGLLDKSLITQSEDFSGRARIGMLQTILEYAREKLNCLDEGTDIRRRHVEFYLALAEGAETRLTGPEQAEVLTQLEREMGNFRRALRWCIDEREADLGVRMGGALARFCRMSSHLAEGRRWMDELVEMFVDTQEPMGCDAPRARLLQEAAAVANTQTDFDAAQKIGGWALACMRKLHDELGEADTLNLLATAARNTGRLEEARSNYGACLKIYRERKDRRGISVVLNNLGLMAWIEGDPDTAAGYQEESLAIRRELGDTWGIANLLSNMAEVAFERGRLAEAEQIGCESLALRRKLGDINGQALALDILCLTAQVQGDLELALARHAECLDLAVQVFNDGIIMTSAQGLAVTAALQGRILEGARLLGAVEGLDPEGQEATETISVVRFKRATLRLRELASAAGVDESMFEAAWKVGRTFTLERLIEEARAIAGGSAKEAVWRA